MNIQRAYARAAHRSALVFLLAMAGGCGGGDGPGGFVAVPVATSSAAPVVAMEHGALPTPTVPVPALPMPEDPSVITRFTKTVPFGEKGKYTASEQIDYQWGEVGLSDPAYVGNLLKAPIEGTLRYPASGAMPPEGFPVIVLLHGMHTSKRLLNSKGYNYLLKDFAENGYVALSIDAAKINGNWQSDAGAQARSQLVLSTLDLLRSGNASGVFNGVELAALKGKLDMARVGLIGHSRGAEGVAYVVALNKKRIGVSYENFEAIRKLRDELSNDKAALTKFAEDAGKAKLAADDASKKLGDAKTAVNATPPDSAPPFTPADLEQLRTAFPPKQPSTPPKKLRPTPF